MAQRVPTTRAVLALRQAGIDFEPHLYRYVEKGGTRASSESLGIEEHAVVKTLVFEDEGREPFLVLMHGDRTVSTKSLARALGAKRVVPCSPATAERHTGYKVGGTSPFGTRHPLRTVFELTILDLERLFINGGTRGFLVSLTPDELLVALEAEVGAEPEPVEVGLVRGS